MTMKIRAGLGRDGGGDLGAEFIHRHQPLTVEVPAALGKFLILEMNRANPHRLQRAHAMGRVVRPAIARVRVHQQRQIHPAGDLVRVIAGFGQGHQPDVRHPAHRVGQHRPGKIARVETGLGDQPRRKRVERARQHHRSRLDQSPQPPRSLTAHGAIPNQAKPSEPRP
jgi:hypothetical protein